jgi:hypothetical protein
MREGVWALLASSLSPTTGSMFWNWTSLGEVDGFDSRGRGCWIWLGFLRIRTKGTWCRLMGDSQSESSPTQFCVEWTAGGYGRAAAGGKCIACITGSSGTCSRDDLCQSHLTIWQERLDNAIQMTPYTQSEGEWDQVWIKGEHINSWEGGLHSTRIPILRKHGYHLEAPDKSNWPQ